MSKTSLSKAWIRQDFDLELAPMEGPTFTTLSLVGESTWESNPALQQEKALLVRTILDISYIWFNPDTLSASAHELENISSCVFVTDDDGFINQETIFFETQQVMDAWLFGGWTTALAIPRDSDLDLFQYVYTGTERRNITVKRRLIKDQFLGLAFEVDQSTTGDYRCNIRIRSSTLLLIP